MNNEQKRDIMQPQERSNSLILRYKTHMQFIYLHILLW